MNLFCALLGSSAWFGYRSCIVQPCTLGHGLVLCAAWEQCMVRVQVLHTIFPLCPSPFTCRALLARPRAGWPSRALPERCRALLPRVICFLGLKGAVRGPPQCVLCAECPLATLSHAEHRTGPHSPPLHRMAHLATMLAQRARPVGSGCPADALCPGSLTSPKRLLQASSGPARQLNIAYAPLAYG